MIAETSRLATEIYKYFKTSRQDRSDQFVRKIRIGALTSICIVTACWTPATFAAESPEKISADFCKAVAAQARCTKVFAMPRDTEQKLENLAGSKLRGDGEALHGICQSGYTEFYTLEDEKGKDEACQLALQEFGPKGSRRAGLVEPRSAPQLKLPEADVEQIATDLCYAMSIAQFCPGVSLATDIQKTLSSTTGADLSKPGVGYFSSECGSGSFRAGLDRGKVELGDFCASGLIAFGSNGNNRAGLLSGDLAKKLSTKVAKAKPAENSQNPDTNRLILTEVPALAAGQTPEDLFGEVPAVYSGAECEQLQASVLQVRNKLSATTNLAEEIQAAIRFKAGSSSAKALCPNSALTEGDIQTASKVKATGLEACHIVQKTVKELDTLSKGFRTNKVLRGVLAVSETQVWALKEFAPICSELTNRRMESSLKFAEQRLQRDQSNVHCQIWYDAFRTTMKSVRKLQSEKSWEDAFALIDGKGAAAFHDMSTTCDRDSYADNAKKQWVSSRQYLQQLALR